MTRILLGGIAFTAFVAASGMVRTAEAADMPIAAPVPALWNWTGAYIGAQAGAATGTASFADPFGASIFGDKVTTPGFLAGGRLALNWQVPNTRWVLGVEADGNWLASDGTNTCLAFVPGPLNSATCHASPDAFGTITARAGYAFGQDGRTLIYAKGGTAWLHNNVDINANAAPLTLAGNPVPNLVTNASFTKWGWTAGAGVERAVAPGWTLSLEYDYLNFGDAGVGTPESIVQTVPGVNAYRIFPPGATTVSQNIHEVKLGINYKIGESPWASWDSVAPAIPYPVKAPVMPAVWLPGWTFDFGTRTWLSSGKFQWNIGSRLAPGNAVSDISRLTYNGLDGYSGEYFQRFETPWNIFVKGLVGIGVITDGHHNDEDWLLFGATVPYSNTASDSKGGKLAYGIVDIGWDTLRGTGYKAGPFVGYSYLTERWDTYGCTQIANMFSDCAPGFTTARLVDTQDSVWMAMRAGLSGEAMLFDRIKVLADVAYLPYVTMTGRDNHLLRNTTTFFDQQGRSGQGVQLDLILSYFITNYWTVGVGGRYWAMWTTSGTDTCTGCNGVGLVGDPNPARFNTERYGLFLQSTFKFNATAIEFSGG